MSGDLVPDRRDLRASHEDRDRVVEQLRVAAGDGRLTADELDERLELALTARTYGELDVLLEDLPAVAGAGTAPEPAPKELVRLQTRSASIRRSGPWAVPRRMEVETRSGNTLIDFTEAVITHGRLDLEVALQSGNLRLVVPPDIAVDVDEVTLHSGNVRNRVRREPGTPVRLMVTVSGTVRSGNLVVRGPRRTFLEWLLRRPAGSRSAR